MSVENKSSLAVLLAVGAALSATISGAAAKHTNASPMLIGAMTLSMSSFGALLAFSISHRVNPFALAVLQRSGRQFPLMGVLFAVVAWLYLGTYQLLPIGDAAMITATAPVLTPFVALLTIGERPSRRTALGIALTIVGCTLAARPEVLFGDDEPHAASSDNVDSSQQRLLGWLFGFGAALAVACMYTAMRQMKDKSSLLVIFHASWMGALLLGVAVGATWPRIGWRVLLNDALPLSVAVGAGIFPDFLLMVAATFADASVVAVGEQSDVVFAFLLQIFWFNSVPPWSSVVGACLIVASVALVGTEDACATCSPRRSVYDISRPSAYDLDSAV